jgi:predicted tellurium resistance membrane protein TerC
VFDVFLTAEAWVSLGTLTALEIVLGIDNIVFITILSGKLPPGQQPRARRLGIGLALVSRLFLLFCISWVMGLRTPFFAVFGHHVSGRDLILLAGGLFLIGKATVEIYDKLEVEHAPAAQAGRGSLIWIIGQIVLLDMVFSLDSVITAVGMARHVSIMVIAMVIAVIVMLVFVGVISDFVTRHPSLKILALAFLLMVGVMLVAEGAGQHIDRGYIYFAMAFSLVVEMINMRVRRAQAAPLPLHERFQRAAPGFRPAGDAQAS